MLTVCLILVDEIRSFTSKQLLYKDAASHRAM
mgnify:FL=1|jgi:hypothetical protein